MNKTFIFLSLIVLSLSQVTDDALIFSKFNDYIRDNNKTYSTIEEFTQRFKKISKIIMTESQKILH